MANILQVISELFRCSTKIFETLCILMARIRFIEVLLLFTITIVLTFTRSVHFVYQVVFWIILSLLCLDQVLAGQSSSPAGRLSVSFKDPFPYLSEKWFDVLLLRPSICSTNSVADYFVLIVRFVVVLWLELHVTQVD